MNYLQVRVLFCLVFMSWVPIMGILHANVVEDLDAQLSFYYSDHFSLQKRANEFGTFYQLKNQQTSGFIHVWARKKNRQVDSHFILNSYLDEFLGRFCQKIISNEEQKRTTEGIVRHHRLSILLLEKKFTVDITISHGQKATLLVALIYEGRDQLLEFQEVINSLEY